MWFYWNLLSKVDLVSELQSRSEVFTFFCTESVFTTCPWFKETLGSNSRTFRPERKLINILKHKKLLRVNLWTTFLENDEIYSIWDSNSQPKRVPVFVHSKPEPLLGPVLFCLWTHVNYFASKIYSENKKPVSYIILFFLRNRFLLSVLVTAKPVIFGWECLMGFCRSIYCPEKSPKIMIVAFYKGFP